MPSLALSDGPDLDAFVGAFVFDEVAISASGISVSAMLNSESFESPSEAEKEEYTRYVAGP